MDHTGKKECLDSLSVKPVCGFAVVVELHLNLWLRLLVAFSRCFGEKDKKVPTARELRAEG